MLLERAEIDSCLFIEPLLVAGSDCCLSLNGFVDALGAVLQDLHVRGISLDLLDEGVEVRSVSRRWVHRHSVVLGCSGVRP